MSALDVNCFLNIGKSGEEVRPMRPMCPSPDARLLLLGNASQEITLSCAVFNGKACSDNCLP